MEVSYGFVPDIEDEDIREALHYAASLTKEREIKIDDDTYKKLKDHAEAENRSVSNFIETAALKYIEQIEFTDDFELEEIMSNTELQKRLRKGSKDAELLRGEFVE